MSDYSDKILFGKNNLERIVSIEVDGDIAVIFTEEKDYTIKQHIVPNRYWILSTKSHGSGWVKLDGKAHYGYGCQYNTMLDFQKYKNVLKKSDIFTINHPTEALLVKDGYTFLKGMDIKEPSILSFDIEATGLNASFDSLLLISNTFRKGEYIEKKLFSYSDYKNRGEMIDDWCTWVRSKDPSILCGHNINGYDIPHLMEVAELNDTKLLLGRDGSPLKMNGYESKFRIDGTRDLTYKKSNVYGRQIIDTIFLSYKYDAAAKKYESYGLKYIIKKEGLEKENRVHYDAGQIRHNYLNPEEWEKIKAYCQDDGDDALALYDLMIAPFFYMTQMIPKPFQMMIESATGSQINAMLCRAYLQDKRGLPKASDAVEYEGAISFGIAGIFKKVFKIDIASMYPSIQLQYKICDKIKDPHEYTIYILDTLRRERFKNKKLYKETDIKLYDHLQNSQKILLNSFYGFMGSSGLNFNYPQGAADITRHGRDIISKTIEWASGKSAQFWIDKTVKVKDES